MSAPTVADLQKKAQGMIPHQSIIEGITRDIDRRLGNHPISYGRNCLTHELPVTFPDSTLDRADAQRFLYSAIVAAYTERGFDPRLSLGRQKTILYLFWDVAISKELKADADRILHSARVDPEEKDTKVFKGLRDGTAPLGSGRPKHG